MDIADKPDALAALAVLQAREKRELDHTDLMALDIEPSLIHAMKSGVVECRLTASTLERTISASMGRQLAAGWRAGASGALHHGLNLRVHAPPSLVGHRTQVLLGSAALTKSVCFDDPGLGQEAHALVWPLRIGFLPDPASRALRAQTAARYTHSALLNIVELGTDDDHCDILLLPGIRVAESIDPATGVRANAVLALEPGLERVPGETLHRLSALVRAQAAGVVIPPDNELGLFSRFIDALARNSPFDNALAEAARKPFNYLLAAEGDWLDASTIDAFLRESGVPSDPDFADALASLRMQPATRPAGVLRSRFRGPAMPKAAPAPSGATHAAAHAREEPAPARWLQAQVHALKENELVRLEQAFIMGTKHQLHVCIAPGQRDWIRLDERFEEIPFEPGQEYLELDVLAMFIGEGVDIPSVIKRIRLPRRDSSEIALFEFTVPPGIQDLEIPLTVMHKGRFVQRGVLSGPVLPTATTAPAARAIEFKRGATAQADPASRTRADLTLIKEKEKVTVRYEGGEYDVDLSGVTKTIDAIRDELYLASTRPNLQQDGLASEAALGLLRMLAVQGAILRAKLFRQNSVHLDKVAVVEVISTYSADSLPVEFLYDLEGPDDAAGLCPCFVPDPRGAKKACKAAKSPRKWVCPAGFWSINRVIGRQWATLQAMEMPGPRAGMRTLPPLKKGILAASKKVDDEVPTATADLLAALEGVTNIKFVRKWKEWVTEIKGENPPLLVALPHNEWIDRLKVEALEIGKADLLRYDRVGAEHVRFSDQAAPPIVLLLGCTTAAAQVSFQDFIAAFRDRGAAIVVGTISKVLGHHTTPVARALISALCNPRAPASFGEVLKQARTEMLRQGNVMSLSLTAFGDMDWQLQ